MTMISHQASTKKCISLNLLVEISSSQLRKNVKTLYCQFDIDPYMAMRPKCPIKECQNVFVNVVGNDGGDKVLHSCVECGAALREGRKLSSLHSTSF